MLHAMPNACRATLPRSHSRDGPRVPAVNDRLHHGGQVGVGQQLAHQALMRPGGGRRATAWWVHWRLVESGGPGGARGERLASAGHMLAVHAGVKKFPRMRLADLMSKQHAIRTCESGCRPGQCHH